MIIKGLNSMTLKKSVTIGGLAIISLSVVIVLIFTLMTIKIHTVEKQENNFIKISENLNKSYLELIVWMDGMVDHIMDEWPFDGGTDHSKSALEKWIGTHIPISDEDEKTISDLKQKNIELFKVAEKIISSEDQESKTEIYLDEFKPVANSIKPVIGGLANLYQEKLTTVREERMRFQKMAGIVITASTLIIIVCVILAMLAILKWVIGPLLKLSDDVVEVGRGNLGVRANYSANNEIGTIASNFNKMVESFNEIVIKIFSLTKVDTLKEVADQTASGAHKQSKQAEQAAVAAEEMSQTISEIAKNAYTASETSVEAISAAEEGKKVAKGAVDTVSMVHTSTIGLAKEIDELNNSILEIGAIITVINSIADQTNLLALNAAIEAARAGEQGRGFAVVADEVRKLAESTIKATAEISEKIGNVQEDSTRTKKSMEESSEVVNKASEYIKNVGNTLQGLAESVLKVRDQVTQIATAVDEQSAAAEQVTKNIEQTADISKDMDQMSRDVMTEVSRITNTAEELKSSVSGFRADGNGESKIHSVEGVMQPASIE
jgi:methyl-accepting chemotaxis protein